MPKKNRPPFAWTEESLKLLGTATDRTVGAALGINQVSVAKKRLSLDIPPFNKHRKTTKGRKRPNFNWTPEAIALLGTAVDTEVAALIGLGYRAVAKKRSDLGIPPFYSNDSVIENRLDLKSQLGKVPDRLIAEQIGISAEAVSHYRKLRSIPATVLRGSFPKEAIPDLGTASDAEIAQRHGVSETTVWRKRKLHGVPSYSPREL